MISLSFIKICCNYDELSELKHARANPLTLSALAIKSFNYISLETSREHLNQCHSSRSFPMNLLTSRLRAIVSKTFTQQDTSVESSFHSEMKA